jgi:signal peptidase II
LKKKHIPWLVIFLVLTIDQVSKILVKTNMTLGQSIPMLGDWFILHFTENAGMAFGFEFGGEYGKLMLSIFRLVAVVFIGIYLYRMVKQGAHTGLIACVSLIMAGALGNIIDSVFYGVVFSESFFHKTAEAFPEAGGYASLLHGKVVDMLYFPIIQTTLPAWVPFRGGEEFIFFRPVFNMADSAITTGVFVLLVFQRRFFHHDAPAADHAKHGDHPNDLRKGDNPARDGEQGDEPGSDLKQVNTPPTEWMEANEPASEPRQGNLPTPAHP